MTTLEIYKMLTQKPSETTKAPKVVSELPDETNLVVVNGILSLVDTENNTIVSVSTIVSELYKLSEMMYVRNGSSCDTIYAVLNFFQQLEDEFKNKD